MSEAAPVRYRSPDEDSGRWLGFPFRAGDIVISTRSKHGTTWLQMICALFVFESSDLPAPLWELSPWLDWLVTPRDDVFARLSAQRHRRFIKTHTPLDRTLSPVVTARPPLAEWLRSWVDADPDLARYEERTAQLAPPELLAWLHRGGLGSSG